nr:hypothetical protein [Pelagicoccus albus]
MLDRWKNDFHPDADLAAKVRRGASLKHLDGESGASLSAWVLGMVSRPLLATGFAAVFVLVGMGISRLMSGDLESGNQELTVTYRLSVDPLYRLQTIAGANEFGTDREPEDADLRPEDPVLLAGMGWLQGELNLSKPQFERVSALHGDYKIEFESLFGELLASHEAYKAFDEERMRSDVIDYLQLYELLENQKRLSERSARLTDELLSRVERVIEPKQRDRYREIVNSIYSSHTTLRASSDA